MRTVRQRFRPGFARADWLAFPITGGCILFFLAVVTSAGAASFVSTNLPPISPALPEAGFSVIRVFGALLLVLGLFLSGAWLFRNWQRFSVQRGRTSQLQIVETKALGGRHALYVVGYQQQRLLLASSPAGVTLVSHLPLAEAHSEADELSSDNFVQALQQAVQGKS
jgi:flagellar biogenesis protein FliO